MDLNASLDTSDVVGPARTAAEALREMKTAAEEAGFALEKTERKAGSSSSKWLGDAKIAAEKAGKAAGKAVRDESAPSSKSEKSSGSSASSFLFNGGKSDKGESAGKAWDEAKKKGDEEAKARNAKEEKAYQDNKKREETAAKARGQAIKNNKKDAAGVASFMKTGLVAGLALGAAKIGVGGIGDLAQIAIGVRGMAQLNAITARAEMNFKKLFKGVDASPLIRAADVFSKNFGPGTVLGKALGDQLTSGFNGFFSMVEKVEPYVTAAMKGAMIGVLDMQTGLYEAGGAFLDLANEADFVVVPLLKISSGISDINAGAAVSHLAFAPLRFAIDTIVIKVRALLGAIDAVKKGNFKDLGKNFVDALNPVAALTGTLADNKPQMEAMSKAGKGASAGDATSKASATAGPQAKAAGMSVGMDMAAGMVLGLNAGSGSVAAAGGALAKSAEAGARTASDTHSPSRVMARFGGDLGDGVVVGIEDSADRIQKAAATSLVPTPTAGTNGASTGMRVAGTGIQITGPLVQISGLVIYGGEDVKMRVLDAMEGAFAQAAENLAQKLSA